MAQQVVATRRRIGPFAGPPVRISWGAIFAGTVSAIGVGILLHALGMALGLGAIDPTNPGSLKGSGIFTGIWSLVTSFVALFVGGLVASRASGSMTKGSGAMHGLVMWGVTTLLAVWLVIGFLSNVIGSVASVGRAAVTGGAGAVAAAAGGGQQLAKTFGLNADDALAPINERLRAEGKPEVTPEQLQAATSDVLQSGLRQGKIDRELLVASIAENTALSRADSEQVANRVEQQFQSAQGNFGKKLKQVQTGALSAAEDTGKAFWGLFAALLLGMLSAVLGATVGVKKRQRLWAEPVGYEFGGPVPAHPRNP